MTHKASIETVIIILKFLTSIIILPLYFGNRQILSFVEEKLHGVIFAYMPYSKLAAHFVMQLPMHYI